MEKRLSKRLDAVMPIMLPTGLTQTKNVSAGGVYFELETNFAENYSVGQDIPIWLHASYGQEKGVAQKQFWLFNNATVVRKAVVVRKEKVEGENQYNRWGFGIEFSNEMETMLSSAEGFY